jgi:ataxin-3
MPILYHEKQESALCGQHCLNNLLQGPYFTEIALAEVAQELDQRERELMLAEGITPEARRFLQEASGNVADDGNFSIQVLSEALRRSHNVTLEDTRNESARAVLVNPTSEQGFILNRHSHWYCMRRLEGQWWVINSTADMPDKLSEFAMAATLAQLAQDKWTVFVARGTLPPPMRQDAGLGVKLTNWVDTSKPPPPSTAFGGGAVRKEEPKFEAFTGAGNTLGGPPAAAQPSAAASAAAGGSEDDQLAFALNLSSALANTERLGARLPPEPEAGAAAARVLVRMADGARHTRKFPADALVQSLVDFACVQLAAADGAAGRSAQWQLVSQHPPLKLKFNADATVTSDEAAPLQTLEQAGLAPSAQLHLSPAV